MRQLHHPLTITLPVVALLFASRITHAQDTDLDHFLRTQLLGTEAQAEYCAETTPALKDQIQSQLEGYKSAYAKASDLMYERFKGSENLKLSPFPAGASTIDPKEWALDIPHRAGPQVFCPWFLTSITDKTPEHIAGILGHAFEQLQTQMSLMKKRLESVDAIKK